MSASIDRRHDATPRLTRAVQAWGTSAFESVLKEEIARMDVDALPLQQGLSAGSISLGDRLGAMILRADGTTDVIRVRAGIFYTSIIAGCACADDPTPVSENAEYCEVELEIDRHSAAVRVRLAGD